MKIATHKYVTCELCLHIKGQLRCGALDCTSHLELELPRKCCGGYWPSNQLNQQNANFKRPKLYSLANIPASTVQSKENGKTYMEEMLNERIIESKLEEIM